jgi:hypothetical protein
MHYLWRRMDEDGRQREWRLYGWFSGLMLCGNCVGAVTWAARVMNLVYFFEGNQRFRLNLNAAEGYSFQALSRKWRAAYVVTYAIEFLCLSAAQLMVLDRMSDFAAPAFDKCRLCLLRVRHAVCSAQQPCLVTRFAPSPPPRLHHHPQFTPQTS